MQHNTQITGFTPPTYRSDIPFNLHRSLSSCSVSTQSSPTTNSSPSLHLPPHSCSLVAPNVAPPQTMTNSNMTRQAVDANQRAHINGVAIAEKRFWSKLCNLAGIGTIAVMQLIQYANLQEGEEVNKLTAGTTLMSLSLAVADCISTFIDYDNKKNGGNGLTLAKDSIALVVYHVSEKCGMSKDSAERSGKTISMAVRTGLMVTQLAQNFGKITEQTISKVVDLPTDITEFTSSLSCNINNDVMARLPKTKIALEHLSEGTQLFTKHFSRLADEHSNTDENPVYLLNSDLIVEVQGRTATLSTFGKIVAYATDSPNAKHISTGINVLHGAGKFIEGQATNLSSMASKIKQWF